MLNAADRLPKIKTRDVDKLSGKREVTCDYGWVEMEI